MLAQEAQDKLSNIEKQKTITLVLTNQCNLSCVYCYEHNKNNVEMDVDLAKSIIDKELLIDDGTDYVEIELFGGEPLLCFDKIKSIVEYTISNEYPKDYVFFATTNGTLLKDEYKPWLISHKDVLQLCLSLDGTREMHNMNRCNSFDHIDLEFFKNNYPTQQVKITISNATLPFLAEGIIFVHKLGFQLTCNLAYGIDWSDEQNSAILMRELQKLMDFYLKNPNYSPCTMLDPERIINVLLPQNEYVKVCGAGWTMKAFDCDGTMYPCQHFLPLSVGAEKAKASLELSLKGLHFGEDMVKEAFCKDCILHNICQTCYGANYETTGDILMPDKNMCQLFKIQYLATSFFVSKLFEKGVLQSKYPDTYLSIIKAALVMNDGLSLLKD